MRAAACARHQSNLLPILQFPSPGLNLAPHPFIIVRSSLCLLAVAAALWPAACSRQRGPIQIGLAGPLSQPRGLAMQRGARLAIDEINAKGGVRGRLLQLRMVDDSASEEQAMRGAQQLYDDARVVAVVGHLTPATSLAAGELYGRGPHPVPMVTPGSSSPDLSGSINPYVFSLFPSDSLHGAALARFAWHTMVARRAGILFLANDYGRALRKSFAEDFTKLGGVVVEADPYLPTTPSIEPYLSRMRHAGIDVLVLAADRAASEMALAELRRSDARWSVIGPDELAGIEAIGPSAAGVRIATAYLPDRSGDRNTAFLADYARAYAGRPDYRGAGAYDAVNILAQAIAAVGVRRDAIRDYLGRVGQDLPAFDGVTGRVSFNDADEDASRAIVVGVIKDGRLVPETSP